MAAGFPPARSCALGKMAYRIGYSGTYSRKLGLAAGRSLHVARRDACRDDITSHHPLTMALFQVDGWDLKEKEVRPGGIEPNNKAKKTKKEKHSEKQAASGVGHEKKRPAAEPGVEEPTPRERSKKLRKNGNETGGKGQEDEHPTSKEPLAPMPQMTSKLTPLQQKMMAKLSGSRFRWINEQLYSTTSEKALKLVESQPALFDEYHQGFRSQVQSWPENPVDVLVEQFKARTSRPINAPGGLPGDANKRITVADMGCGEAQFAADLDAFVKAYNGKKTKQNKKKPFSQQGPKALDVKVHSFDLKKANDRITVADIKNVPLEDESCNIVIFCLALMGTNFLDFIEEAYRILAPNGELWIAEIKSRFSESSNSKEGVQRPDLVGSEFVESLKVLGFYHKKTDNENKMFTRFEFFKPSREILSEQRAKLQRKQKFVESESRKEELESKRKKRPEGQWLLKPCIYKRR